MDSALKFLPAKRKGVTFFFQGKYLASKYDPFLEAERILSGFQWRKGKTLIFLGFFPFYHIYKVFQTSHNFQNLRVFILDEQNFTLTTYQKVVEETKLCFSQKEGGFSFELEKILFKITELKSVLEQLTDEEMLKTIFIESPYLTEESKNQCQKKFANWKKQKQKVILTEKYFTLFWYFNALRNLKLSPISLIEDIFVLGEIKKPF